MGTTDRQEELEQAAHEVDRAAGYGVAGSRAVAEFLTASERIRAAREAKACPFCESTRAAKFEGTRICSDKAACMQRIARQRQCFCPDDCNCHYPWRPNVCGCSAHAEV